MNIKEGEGPTSDHSPILLILSQNVITKKLRPSVTNKKTDWEVFNGILN